MSVMCIILNDFREHAYYIHIYYTKHNVTVDNMRVLTNNHIYDLFRIFSNIKIKYH